MRARDGIVRTGSSIILVFRGCKEREIGGTQSDMNHLENLIKQYYEWKGYVVRTNIKVGKREKGGWEGELDIVAYHPKCRRLIHLEPSTDAYSWATREERYTKKFAAGREYIRTEVFPWLDATVPIEQIAVLISSSRKVLAGGEVKSIDELMGEIKNDIAAIGKMSKSAIPQEYDLLRTIQLVVSGY